MNWTIFCLFGRIDEDNLVQHQLEAQKRPNVGDIVILEDDRRFRINHVETAIDKNDTVEGWFVWLDDNPVN